MTEFGSNESRSGPQPTSLSPPAGIVELREARTRLHWAAKRARSHLVRLGKWRRERGDPTRDDLSGGGHIGKDWGQERYLDGSSQHQMQVPRRHARAQGRDNGGDLRQAPRARRGLD